MISCSAECAAVATRRDLLTLIPPGRRIAELGVFRGDFAAEILSVCAPAELHLIDRWDGLIECGDKDGLHIVREWGNTLLADVRLRFLDHPYVKLHKRDTCDALSRFPDGYFDFVYIDADHSEAAVAADLRMASTKCRGPIGGHDYCAAFDGVRRAVDAFVAASGRRLVYLTQDGCPSYFIS